MPAVLAAIMQGKEMSTYTAVKWDCRDGASTKLSWTYCSILFK